MRTERMRSLWPRVFALLVVAYFAQGVALYRGGGEPREWVTLSEPARAGQALWRKHACHSCHQIHGLGGFLGPDLTNVVRRRTPEEIADVLTTGRRQMPAFRMSADAIGTLVKFLEELDGTGTAVATWRPAALAGYRWPTGFHFAGRERAGGLRERLVAAEALVTANGCASCHVPFATGRAGAPDLTLTRSRRTAAEVAAVLRDGQGAMPGFTHLTASDCGLIAEYVGWLGERRASLGARASAGEAARWREIPWFEIQ